MITTQSKVRCLLLASLLMPVVAAAQDSGALIDVLIRKGILTNQEAEDIRAELVRENNTVPSRAMAGGKSTDRLSVGMRMQVQAVNIDTDIDGVTAGPPAASHAFLRRMYLTLKATVGGNWGATMTYDFASGGYDDAIIEWRPKPDLSFDFGLRKVNVVYEERASSGNLKSIERSGVTRYFAETNNGRRLGAASYRIGAFLDARKELSSTTGLVYGVAVTNPERSENFSEAAGVGDGTVNLPAFWGNIALNGKLANGTWHAGVTAGYLPDQGGSGNANRGNGHDLSLFTAFFDLTAGRFGFLAEYMAADVEQGAVAANRDAKPAGFFLQPSLLLTDTFELVGRYQWLDSDGRGLNMSDVVRSAPSGGTMNTFSEWYAGANWYLRGNDLKWQLGGFYGKTNDTVTGGKAEAETIGGRTQVQIQF